MDTRSAPAAPLLLGLGHALRLTRAAFVMAREGAFVGLDLSAMPMQARAPLALANLLARRNVTGFEGLSRAMARLGPSYVKLGQFLSTRPDIVGEGVASALESLQDRVAPMPREQAAGIVEAALGAPIGTLFAHFGEPVAAASIAQVHRAMVRDGEGERTVAVKVLRKGVEKRLARDLADMRFAAGLAERFAPPLRRLKPNEVVATLARSVRLEMDFRFEASAASEFAENLQRHSEARAPAIDWDRTAREVMTMEWVEGLPLADPEKLAALGFDPKALARSLIQTFLRCALHDGFFHADMHQGNLFVDQAGQIALVDFGIMSRLGRSERRLLAETLYGFIRRDYQRVAEAHFEIGYVPDSHRVEEFAQALRAIGEPIHQRTADQISMAKVLSLMFEITALFDMSTRTELVLLQKTMVVVEGVARKLDPQLDMWSTAEPVVAAWIAENLGPQGVVEDARRSLAAMAQAVRNAPERLSALSANLDAALSRAQSVQPYSARPDWGARAIFCAIGFGVAWWLFHAP